MSKDVEDASNLLGEKIVDPAQYSIDTWVNVIHGALRRLHVHGSRMVRTLQQRMEERPGHSRMKRVADTEVIRRALPVGITLGTLFIECVEMDLAFPRRWEEVPKRVIPDPDLLIIDDDTPGPWSKRCLLLKWHRTVPHYPDIGVWHLYLLRVDWQPAFSLACVIDNPKWHHDWIYEASAIHLVRIQDQGLRQLIENEGAAFGLQIVLALGRIQNEYTTDLSRSIRHSSESDAWFYAFRQKFGRR